MADPLINKKDLGHTSGVPLFSEFSLKLPTWFSRILDPSDVTSRKDAVSWVLVYLSYLVTAQVGVYLYREIGTSPALIWPPVGIALAAVLVEGYWIWSAIALAALTNSLMVPNIPIFIAIGSMMANTIQPLVGGYILRKFNYNPLMKSLREVFILVLVAGLVTSIMPLINYAWTGLYDILFSADRPLPAWPTIWVGGALSALVLTPFLSRWVGSDFAHRRRITQIEAVLGVASVAVLAYLMFATPLNPAVGTTVLMILIAALFWVAFRCGPQVMSVSLLILTSVSLAGAIYGIHAPSPTNQTLAQRLISTEMFDLILCFFFFILVSVEEQRKEAVKTLSQEADQLANALEAIRSDDRAKNEFIATLAHELRNPLAPIVSGLELLRIDEENPDRLEIIDSARRQSHVMRRLLDELLDVARITRRTFILHKEDADVHRIVEDSIQSVSYFFKERKITFTKSISDEKMMVHADSVRLMQVLTNILFNAGKYTEPGGSIHLSLEKRRNIALVTVKDTGIGIPEEMLSKIFDLFVQDRSTSPIGTGLGIGLSIAKRLVELHGGTIKAQSEGTGKGSIFTIEFPLVEKSESKIRATTQFVSVPTSILVVDDNKDAAKNLAKLLTVRGHNVDVVFSGQDALSALSKRPEVVILDVELPDIDGHDVAREIRKQAPQTAVIALSGYGSKTDKEGAFAAGVRAHLTKPASLSEIEQVLATL